EKRIHRPDFQLPAGLDRYGPRLIAENAYYRPPQLDRPGGYLLEQVEQPTRLETEGSLPSDGPPVLLTPRDYGWLKPDECFVVSDVNFEQLTSGRAFSDFASTAQMISGLSSQSFDGGADLRVEIHSRVVHPLLDVTLLFLGLPLVVSRQSRNVFAAIGLCGTIVTVFMLVVMACQQLGAAHYLPSPALAAWLPLMLFVPVAVWMAESMRE
ncbi:hypothetical protein LCGC14_2928200, partial [marine sediment metagenome]